MFLGTLSTHVNQCDQRQLGIILLTEILHIYHCVSYNFNCSLSFTAASSGTNSILLKAIVSPDRIARKEAFAEAFEV